MPGLRELLETALGLALVACLVLATCLLPCAVLDIVAGTSLTARAAVLLLLALGAAAMLSVASLLNGWSSKDRPDSGRENDFSRSSARKHWRRD